MTRRAGSPRLVCLAAQHIAYGKKDVQYFGPMYESMKVEADKIRIRFSHADGLRARGDEPKGFTIAHEGGDGDNAAVTFTLSRTP